MANSLLTINMITRKALALFRNSNALLMMVDKQYDDQFSRSGAKIGASLRIRLPNDYVVRTGATAVPQSTQENQVTLAVATQQGVDFSFSSADLSLSLDDFSERILAPGVNVLAGAVAVNLMSGVEGVPNFVQNAPSGTLASPTTATILQAGAVLDLNSCPRTDRNFIVDPVTMARSVSNLSGLFNPQDKIGRQYSMGMIYANVLGFNWAMDQTVLLHTGGTFSAGTISGANQTGATLTTNAITGTLAAGDIITISGVNQVNRVNKTSTGSLQQFVVLNPVLTSGTSINVYPSLNPPISGISQPYQTVTASPADSATIALVNTASGVYRKNMAFHPTAITLASADLDMPTKAVISTARERYDGLAIRMIEDYITINDQWLTRLDFLYGYLYPRPEWACIVADVV